MKNVYLIDEGILLEKDNPEFPDYSAYDNKYGYYDENQFYISKKSKANRLAKKYVENGEEKTYAIVSKTSIDDTADINDCPVEGESYLLEDVVYSVAKINGVIVENFLNK